MKCQRGRKKNDYNVQVVLLVYYFFGIFNHDMSSKPWTMGVVLGVMGKGADTSTVVPGGLVL